MYTTRSSVVLSSLLLLGARSVAAAECSAVWSKVAQDMVSEFAGCSDYARMAIRGCYHDCAPESCDASLILTDECDTRPENEQLRPYCHWLKNEVSQYGVGAADAIQLGLAIAVKSCRGPPMPFLVGRQDSYTPNPPNQLPPPTSSAEQQVAVFTKFTELGFTAADCVALSGAHTIGKTLAGQALDDSVSTWDNTFYSDTLYHKAPATLPSDANLANGTETTGAYHSFAMSAAGWEWAFEQAYRKMSVIGNDRSRLYDCSSIVTAAFPN